MDRRPSPHAVRWVRRRTAPGSADVGVWSAWHLADGRRTQCGIHVGPRVHRAERSADLRRVSCRSCARPPTAA